MNVKVSIIIPVYNVASFLDACLSSCINQTFHDLEIIVVNDGSTDESPLIIQRYAEKDDRIKVITKENQGLIYARKSGLERACGEYVFHLDGDDYLEISTIAELYNEAIKCGADYVIANYYEVCDNNRLKMRNTNEYNGLCGQELLLCMFHNGGWTIWGKLMHKSLFDGIIYYPVVMGEDLFLNMQICLKVKKVIVVDACLYNYVYRLNSITNQKKKMRVNLKFDMAKNIFYLLDIYPYNQPIKEKVYLMFYYCFLSCIRDKEMSLKNILYDYYWNKKEVRDFLWKKRKDFYLIINVFFRYPAIASIMAKIYLFLIDFRRSMKRFKYELINK
ncbi:MAG: glycosyltransferase family 2 protein [Parabacteroides gordonii]|uniref:glycosyltransferase family 2 protein n=1 Tax=Parabacteroides gordonii TaxID=574930 RepID=UPI003A840602